MPGIRPIGGYFPLDEEEFLVNPCRKKHISKAWRPVVEAVLELYREEEGARLHSVWLRGSVARGMAVDGLSDLDTFALVYAAETFHWQPASWAARREKELSARFYPLAAVELVLNTYRSPLEAHNPRLAMLIATQSLCLWGEDLRSRLPRYRPGPEMALYARWLERDVNEFLDKEMHTAVDFQQIAKLILRAGFELVMERARKFTPDLYWCYHAFAEWYPDKEADMRAVLNAFLEPAPSDRFFLGQVEKLTVWLIKELIRHDLLER